MKISKVTDYAALRNEFDFWKVRGIMNTSDLLQSFTLTLQETRSSHYSMNLPKLNLLLLSVKYQFSISPNLAGFPNILN